MTKPDLDKTIRTLRRASKKGAAIWGALADDLDKSKRGRVAVNVSAINRHWQEGGIVAVPGKVLGSGTLTQPATVAAFSFSSTAQRKIHDAKGRAMGLKDLLTEGIDPSKVRILK